VERKTAIRLSARLVELLDRRGEDLGRRDATTDSTNPQAALARMAAERVPGDAIAAVTGETGGEARFAAVSPSKGCLYLLEPMKFEIDKQQRASARCRVIRIDPARSYVEIESRWWGYGEDNRRTEWRICIGPETLAFVTERDLEEEESAEERFARAVCEAAGVPVSGDEGAQPRVRAV
jgi:hypothetical protein